MADAQSSHLLLRAARGEPVERPPVWAMRQAGRWDPAFQRVRQGTDFFAFSEDVERAAEATLCPKRFGVDGIILFYDITTLPHATGLPFTLQPSKGPVPNKPVRTLADVEKIDEHPDPSRYGYIIELLRTVKKQLNDELPVLAFAGAPFTVAAYCIGTGKNMDETRRFAAEQPVVWKRLLERICHATIGFLQVLIQEGAEFYQLFDSWAGELTPHEYEEWAMPYHTAILAGATGVPRVLFVKECPYLDRMTHTGADAISLGSCHDLAAAKKQYPHLVFQGNVPQETLRNGTPDDVRQAVQACRAAGAGHRHILNLNHGVDKDTPVANFEAYIRAAKEPS